MHQRFFCLWLVLVLIQGCEPGTSGQSELITTRDSAGTEIVLVSGSASSQGPAAWISPQPVLSIGETAGPNPDAQFSRITGVGRLSDSRIVVLESQVSEVRWFDSNGRHLLTRGGHGEGPGEFDNAWSIVRIRGDTVVVENRPRVKHVFFGQRGEFIGETLQDQAAFWAMGPWVECADFTLPDRSRVVCQDEPGQPTGPAQPGHHRRFTRFVRVPWDLSGVDTLGLCGGIEQWGIEVGSRTRFAVHPHYSWTHTAAGGDPIRVAIAVNPEYRIEIWTPEGHLERVLQREDGRRAPTREEISWARNNLSGLAMIEEAQVDRIRAEIPSPDSLPAVADLVMGRNGEVWVRHNVGRGLPGTTGWDVFDAAGRFRGEVSLPERFTPHDIGEDYILGVRTDALRVPFVEMYALERRWQ